MTRSGGRMGMGGMRATGISRQRFRQTRVSLLHHRGLFLRTEQTPAWPGLRHRTPLIPVLPLFAALAERLNATASLEGLAFTDTSDSINKLYQDLRAMCE